MAVDYFHRLVVWGRQPAVREFTQASRLRARYAQTDAEGLQRSGLTH
jgi:hypothetical protein